MRDLFFCRWFALGYFTPRLWYELAELKEIVRVILGNDDVLCH